MNDPIADDLTPAVMTDSEFEAEAKAEVIRSEGIDAFVFPHAAAAFGFMLGGRMRVPVMVRREDVDRARAALKQRIEDSIDLDWDEVDVGDPPTDADHHRSHLGVLPRIAFIVTALVLLMGIVAAIVMVFM